MIAAVVTLAVMAVASATAATVFAVKLGSARVKLTKALDARDDYRQGLHDLRDELSKNGLSAARDIHVLEGKVNNCRAVINDLPESDLTHTVVNAMLDQLLQGEDRQAGDPPN